MEKFLLIKEVIDNGSNYLFKLLPIKSLQEISIKAKLPNNEEYELLNYKGAILKDYIFEITLDKSAMLPGNNPISIYGLDLNSIWGIAFKDTK